MYIIPDGLGYTPLKCTPIWDDRGEGGGSARIAVIAGIGNQNPPRRRGEWQDPKAGIQPGAAVPHWDGLGSKIVSALES